MTFSPPVRSPATWSPPMASPHRCGPSGTDCGAAGAQDRAHCRQWRHGGAVRRRTRLSRPRLGSRKGGRASRRRGEAHALENKEKRGAEGGVRRRPCAPASAAELRQAIPGSAVYTLANGVERVVRCVKAKLRSSLVRWLRERGNGNARGGARHGGVPPRSRRRLTPRTRGLRRSRGRVELFAILASPSSGSRALASRSVQLPSWHYNPGRFEHLAFVAADRHYQVCYSLAAPRSLSLRSSVCAVCVLHSVSTPVRPFLVQVSANSYPCAARVRPLPLLCPLLSAAGVGSVLPSSIPPPPLCSLLSGASPEQGLCSPSPGLFVLYSGIASPWSTQRFSNRHGKRRREMCSESERGR